MLYWRANSDFRTEMHREMIDGTIPMRSDGGMKHLLFLGGNFIGNHG